MKHTFFRLSTLETYSPNPSFVKYSTAHKCVNFQSQEDSNLFRLLKPHCAGHRVLYTPLRNADTDLISLKSWPILNLILNFACILELRQPLHSWHQQVWLSEGKWQKKTVLKIYYLAERHRKSGIFVVKNLRKISRHRTKLYFATNKNVDVMVLADHSRNFMEFLAPNWWVVPWFPKGDGFSDRYPLHEQSLRLPLNLQSEISLGKTFPESSEPKYRSSVFLLNDPVTRQACFIELK